MINRASDTHTSTLTTTFVPKVDGVLFAASSKSFVWAEDDSCICTCACECAWELLLHVGVRSSCSRSCARSASACVSIFGSSFSSSIANRDNTASFGDGGAGGKVMVACVFVPDVGGFAWVAGTGVDASVCASSEWAASACVVCVGATGWRLISIGIRSPFVSVVFAYNITEAMERNAGKKDHWMRGKISN